jgi:hypothetical protein
MKKMANPLKPGAVIQTHPQRGFWGCAVVLSAHDGTDQFHPMCHIGITSFIAKRRYAWNSIDARQLRIATVSPAVRVGPNEYRKSDPRTCIGIYSVKTAASLAIIGTIDPTLLYERPLTLEVGDGTKGTFPLCGPIKESLGTEAVVAWRKVNDHERLATESAAHRENFERHERTRLSEQRSKVTRRGI